MLAHFICAVASPWQRINIGFWLIQCITWNSETPKSTLRLAQRQRKFIRIILYASHSIQMASTKRHLFLIWRKIGTEKKNPGKSHQPTEVRKKSYLQSKSSSRTSVRGTFCWALHLKRPFWWKERAGRREQESSWDLRIKKNKNVIHLMCFHFGIFLFIFRSVFALLSTL